MRTWLGRTISTRISSLGSTVPPVSRKQPLVLRLVTVASPWSSTPSQRAGKFTFRRGARLRSLPTNSLGINLKLHYRRSESLGLELVLVCADRVVSKSETDRQRIGPIAVNIGRATVPAMSL